MDDWESYEAPEMVIKEPHQVTDCVLCGKPLDGDGFCSRVKCLYSLEEIMRNVGYLRD